jgi:hypothetical protein
MPTVRRFAPTAPPPEEPDFVYPAPSTLANVTPTSVALPSVGVKTLDPTWDTYYTRVTSGTVGGHQYPSHRPWNADETWFYDHYASQLVNAQTWAAIGSRGRPSEPIWSHTNRLRMYGMIIESSTFGYRNMSTDASTTLFTFPDHGAVNFGNNDGGFSWDDRYFLFRGITSSGQRQMLVLDRKTGGIEDNCSIVATLNITNDPDNYKMSASGQRCVINWENNNGTGSNQGVWLYNFTGSSLVPVRQLNENGDHGDCGKDKFGNDIYVCSYVTSSNTNPNIYSYRLDVTGQDIGRLLPQTSGLQFQQGHVSTQNIERWGWAYLSSYRDGYNVAGRGQVIAVPTDGTAFSDGNPVEVYGFHRSMSLDTQGGVAYTNQPMACPNRYGNQVAIKTKWSTVETPSTTHRSFILEA